MTSYKYGEAQAALQKLRDAARLKLSCRLTDAECGAILRELKQANQESRALAEMVQEANAPTN